MQTTPMADQDEQQSALEQFGINLTDRARQGKLDPVIGRDAEIRRITGMQLVRSIMLPATLTRCLHWDSR